MLKSLFTINLNQKLLSGKVAFGRFDGQHCSMVAVFSDDKILIHQPYVSNKNLLLNNVSNSNINEINILNINQKINGICCGKFNTENDYEVLVVGTQTSLLVFDIHNNKELFFKNISDGSNAVALGEINNKVVALSGGNCAIQGFDYEGNDSYWTVTGNNVTCLDICDLNKEGKNGILTGSDGNEICFFQNENIIFDLQETDKIKFLCFLEKNYFAYALYNGTVGVYNEKERIWRIKSKKEIVALKAWDVNNDGTNELITGWSSGKVDIRDIKTGQVLHKEVFKDSIAGILICDYNMDRKDELVIVTVNGELKGFESTTKNENKIDQAEIKKIEQEKIREMLMLKNNLLLELRNYENNKLYKDLPDHKQMSIEVKDFEENEYGAIPANTQLKSTLSISKNYEDLKDACIELSLRTTNDTIIRAAIIFAEGIFDEESFIAHPLDLEVSNDIIFQLKPEKNVSVDLHVKAIVGYHKSDHYHVFELSRTIPKFSMFAVQRFIEKTLEGKATYSIDIKANQLISWINKNFLVDENIFFTTGNQLLTINLQCLRTNNYCVIELNENENQLSIQCDSMQIAGELFQSISELQMNQKTNLDLNCVLYFPKEIEQLKNLIEKVNSLESVHQQLNADFADNSSIIKQLLIKAEDARLLDEFKLMKQYYSELNSMNKSIINDFQIRNQNKQELISCLKTINVIIQQAANLRIGSYKTQIIKTCREAIKNNNLNLISRIIVTGENLN